MTQPRSKVTPTLKHKLQESLKTPQPTLFKCAPSLHTQADDRHSAGTFLLVALYATPSVCRGPGGHRWWNLRCSHTQNVFIGLYSISERDYILDHFKDRQHRIRPYEFDLIASEAIALCAQQVGVTL